MKPNHGPTYFGFLPSSFYRGNGYIISMIGDGGTSTMSVYTLQNASSLFQGLFLEKGTALWKVVERCPYFIHFGVLLWLTALFIVSHGTSPHARAAETALTKNETIHQAIKKEEASFNQADQEADAILESLDTIAKELNRRRLKASAISRELEDQTRTIHELGCQKTELTSEISQNRHHLNKRVVALYHIVMMNRYTPLPPKEHMFEQLIRRNAVTTIVEKDIQILRRFQRQWEELDRLDKKLKIEIQEKKRLDMALFDEMWELEQKERTQKTILQRIQNEKKLHLAAVVALQKAKADLYTELHSMETDEDHLTPKEHTGIPADSPHFSDRIGTLTLPVKGKILSKFGRSRNNDDSTFTFQSGIDIKTRRGEPVKSFFKGTVVYSQWLRGYGNVIIIDHGNSYYTLYAHLDERFKQKGVRVDTGDVIATAGDTGSLKGVHLHFEVRHHHTPVNPMKWVKKGA